MTLYAKIIDGTVAAYPYHLYQLKIDFPDTSFPNPPELADLSVFDVWPVVESVQPGFNQASQKIQEGVPALVEGIWTQQWAVRAATQAEMDAHAAVLAQQAQDAADEAARVEAKADAIIKYLMSHTPAQIVAKVDADVTNLATAKTYIAKLAVAVCVLARKGLR